MGSLNKGLDIIESLHNVCVANSIFCATLSGVGYIKNPKFRHYDVGRRGFTPSVEHEGWFHVVSTQGNVSLQNRQTVIRCHVLGTLKHEEAEAIPLDGELIGGEIVAFEFSLTTNDDIRLYRAEDPETGLDPWLHMDLGDGPPPSTMHDPEVEVIDTRYTAPDSKNTGDAEGENCLQAGDSLDHPTLGTCRIVNADDDEKLSITLQSGRTVEIHRTLLNLEAHGTNDEGGTLYKVHIKRRR